MIRVAEIITLGRELEVEMVQISRIDPSGNAIINRTLIPNYADFLAALFKFFLD